MAIKVIMSEEKVFEIGILMWQFMADELREFIKTKTHLDPVYSFNPSEEEIKDKIRYAGNMFIETFGNVGEENEWISVKDRLPELHTKVLCCGKKGGRFIAEMSIWGDGDLYWTKRDGKGCSEVTHWMPLPEAPKGVK